MDLAVIKQIAFEQLGTKNSHEWKEKGNKYYHGDRVAKLAIELRMHILPGDSSHDEILTVAAWFHDIMNGIDDHAKLGAVKAREILKDFCSTHEMDEIYNIISVHDDRHPDSSLYSNYVKLQQDADHLDHFGTYDIWTEFLYATHDGDTIIDVIDWFQNVRPKYDARFRAELNFELSRRIYDEKSEFLRSFTDRLSVEFSGGFWGLADLLEEQKGIG